MSQPVHFAFDVPRRESAMRAANGCGVTGSGKLVRCDRA